jgi:acetoin utilization deacetylase AcuC-like enzyme
VLTLPVVHAPRQAAHAVLSGVWCGVAIASDELPIRADVLVAACRDAGAEVHTSDDHGLEPLLAVHDARLVETLGTAYQRWVDDGHLVDPGAQYVTAYVFPSVAGVHGGDPARPAATIRAEIGRFAMDTMTAIGPGTWEGARAAADAAVAAADLVLAGRPAAYAICRPPGHHAGRAFFGGSCYLNNAAVAVGRLRAGGTGRVAVVDIDAHHGNGTQAIFWDDPSVLYASLHIDPGAGWFPHTVGYADERDAAGTNHNMPLPPETDDDGWLGALDAISAGVRRFDPDVLVVSLGVDAATEDPNSPLRVTQAGFTAAGRRLADLGRPTVLVQEGGYVLDTLGEHVLAVLRAF